MITQVYIIRKDLNKFFSLDPETDNWEWSPNLEEATIYTTPDKAELIRSQRKLGDDTYIYQMPYSMPEPQLRKRKQTKKPKGRTIRKGKSKKR